ncbi:hypothetical protein [Actinacidiphila glaucinigra]|uniref:hypothetical protein n=1 Tax=Actinacidiphila glaucinigra TaxID=235986 RepID=UPI0036709098
MTEYVDGLPGLADALLADRRHFSRADWAGEPGRMTTAPATRSVSAHEHRRPRP